LDCSIDEVLGLLDPNNPSPVFSEIEPFCWPKTSSVDSDVAGVIPISEVSPVLTPNKKFSFYLIFYKSTLNNSLNLD